MKITSIKVFGLEIVRVETTQTAEQSLVDMVAELIADDLEEDEEEEDEETPPLRVSTDSERLVWRPGLLDAGYPDPLVMGESDVEG